MQWYGRGGYSGRKIGEMFGQGDLGDKLGDVAWGAAKQFIPGHYAAAGDALFGVTDKFASGNVAGNVEAT